MNFSSLMTSLGYIFLQDVSILTITDENKEKTKINSLSIFEEF